MGKTISIVLSVFLLVFFGTSSALAITDPLSVPNNRIGVHILDTPEIAEAAKLVNSSGGDWGYVTIPIRSNDRDLLKWTKFMEDARRLHIVPIIRLATYPEDNIWAAPTAYDLVDFANFLDQLPWPTQNRYLILFNEPNHASEWGGTVSPLHYATLLLDAKPIFKAHSQNYFLLTAGLDMSLPTSKTSLDALEFYRQMTVLQPKWYDAIDGISVHAYPNPGFSSSVHSQTRFGISSFTYEQKLLSGYGFTHKPFFVTETGWMGDLGAAAYPTALSTYWPANKIVAITPFVLQASGNFAKFSLLNTASYRSLFNYPKIAGSPLLDNVTITQTIVSTITPSQSFVPSIISPLLALLNSWFHFSPKVATLTLGTTSLQVEIADTDAARIQGLSGRPNLPQDTGLLFVFPKPARHTFWMKDMRFDLDFIWIADGKIVELNENIPAPSKTLSIPRVITPTIDATMVLEVPAGYIHDHGLQVRDLVVLR